MSRSNHLLRSRLRDAAADVMLEAAEKVMAKKGFNGATMQDIAAAAGCAVGTLYLYFKNKEELLRGILLKYGASLQKTIFEDFGDIEDPVEKLRLFIAAHLEWGQQHPQVMELVSQSLPLRYYDFKASLRRIVPKEHEEMQRVEMQYIRDAQRAGSIRRDIPAAVLAELVDGFLFTVMDQFSARPDAFPLQKKIDMVWGFLTTGLEARPPRPPRPLDKEKPASKKNHT